MEIVIDYVALCRLLVLGKISILRIRTWIPEARVRGGDVVELKRAA